MKFTREELEDIWNNKPYGYFTNIRKNKLKKYTIEASISKVTETRTIHVYDQNINGRLIDQVKHDFRKEMQKEFGNNITISYRIYPS